jgi:hypothetical protein
MSQNFGWIPPEDRTPEQTLAHETIMASMPPLSFGGGAFNEDEKVDLTELWDHAQVVAALGFAFPGVYQQVGSCVGAAGGNMAFTVCCVDALRLNEPEKLIVPFWLLPYARSRFYGNMPNPGDGSFGSTFAKAAKEDGFLDARMEGLPKFENNEGLIWLPKPRDPRRVDPQCAEMVFSDGDAQNITALLPESRKHLIQTVTQINTTDELEAGIRRLYPATNASSLIPNPTIEADGEAYGRVARSGGHQTTFLGVWRHPTKGLLFKYVNQWSTRWGKKGACWIPASDAQAIINNGRETYLFSQYNGYPAQLLDWRQVA